ncbi:DoxX family protein [Cellulomonas alba]|uniref:DoxX family protein n=1 Tax=Cellulomonas alba TaxID=3053467 RepID=A0ABT7SEC9_9CELL|nr:DoxX family protein [Cellulomonas alba]MDM7854520.1 DoxX family protein [Cellulomonas alba]
MSSTALRPAARSTATTPELSDNTLPVEYPTPAPTAPRTLADRGAAAVDQLAHVLTRHSITALRVALGLVFLGFGILKFFPGVSPAQELVQRTIGALTLHHVGPGPALLATAIMETVIGLTLVTGRFLRSGLVLLAMALVGIMSPLVLFFHELFPAGGPTLTAQYVLKDLVLAAAGAVIGAAALGARLRLPQD